MIVKYTMKMTISDEIIVANELAYRLYAKIGRASCRERV